jgi:hypothetical protein
VEESTSLPEVWAQKEFGSAQLGDSRRTQRLVQVAQALAERPQGTLPGTFSSWAELKGAYRLFATEDATYDKVIGPHWERTRRECREGGEYFLIEDSTLLDFSNHPGVEGLGRIGDDAGLGFNLHTTLALRVEGWNQADEPEVTAIGLFGQRCWTRQDPPKKGRETKLDRLKRPRESERWAAVFEESGGPPVGARWTFVADREGDIYEVFEKCERAGVEFDIRASQPRALQGGDRSVFQAVARSPLKGSYSLEVRARPGQAARTARLEVRATTVTLRPPQRPGGRSDPFTVNVVEAREVHPPKGVEAIHWVLLTSWPVETFKHALRVIKAYSQRWLIEEYHKALKTGVHMERSQLSTAKRIQALLGVLAVVAVRLLQTKLLATSKPDERVDPEQIRSEALDVLEARFGKPKGGWTQRTLFESIARMGGFLARKGDGSPGWLTIWRGWQRLALMAEGYGLAQGG